MEIFKEAEDREFFDNIRKLELANLDLMRGIFFDDIEKYQGFYIATNHKLKDSTTWNFGGAINVSKNKLEYFIVDVEEIFVRKEKNPTFYLTPATAPASLESRLKDRGYKLAFQDAWMIFSGKDIIQSKTLSEIKPVSTAEDMQVFVELFMSAHQGQPSPDNPYAGLPSVYIDVLMDSFLNSDNREKLTYYLGLQEGKAVCYGGLAAINNVAQLFAIGTDPEYRGRGFGSSMTNFLTAEAMKKGISKPFLLTETDSKNKTFYSKLNYETSFVGKTYSKQII